jgi:hypothetical protein
LALGVRTAPSLLQFQGDNDKIEIDDEELSLSVSKFSWKLTLLSPVFLSQDVFQKPVSLAGQAEISVSF